MYIRTIRGDYLEVEKTEECGDILTWRVRSALYSNEFDYFMELGYLKAEEIDYELDEEDYVVEIARWLLYRALVVGTRERVTRWAQTHGWEFEYQTNLSDCCVVCTRGSDRVVVGVGKQSGGVMAWTTSD